MIWCIRLIWLSLRGLGWTGSLAGPAASADCARQSSCLVLTWSDGVSFVYMSYPKHNYHHYHTINNDSLAQHIKQTTIRIHTTCHRTDNTANTLRTV
jgi:hypothetical protein